MNNLLFREKEQEILDSNGADQYGLKNRVDVLHILESWRPVILGYTTRSWEIISVQSQSSSISPHVLVSSRQYTHGQDSVTIPPEMPNKIRLSAPSLRENLIRKFNPFFLDAAHLKKAIKEICASSNVKIIHGHYSSGIGIAAANVASTLGLKYVAEIRFDLAGAISSESWLPPPSYIEKLLRIWLERHSHKAAIVVAACYSLAELVKHTFPQLDREVVVIPNGVDCIRFTPTLDANMLRHKLGLDNKLVIGSTSSMLHYEGLSILIESFAEIKLRIPNVHALFIGAGPQTAALKQAAVQAQLPITFLDPVPFDDIPLYYNLFDVYVVPRLASTVTRYASPIKVLEAMASGLAIVASDVGDIPYLLADGRGVLIPPASCYHLVDAIIELAIDTQRRNQIGRKAEEWVRINRTWPQTLQKYERLYADVLRES